MDNTRIPVIIGVGQVNDREDDPLRALDSQGLMAAALRAADQDAGGGWLAKLDFLGVVNQLSCPELNPVAGALAQGLGASPRFAEETDMPSGDSPILLLNEAANRIAAGEFSVAAIVGGEALRTAGKRAALAAKEGKPPGQNLARELSERATPAYRHRYGLVAPVDIYPLYENAGRAAYGQTLTEGQAETGEIWSRLSQVAAENEGAWLRRKLDATEIRTPSTDNRPISFPYTKLMVANSSVNQGAGFIVASLQAALAAGIAESRLIYVGAGVAAHESDEILARDTYVRSASMETSIRQTLAANGLSAADIDAVELYSCFPCVPKMARRVLGFGADRPLSVVGGLTFGGGPIGNYMGHAVVAMVQHLRRNGKNGLLFANGGLATHNHSIVISRQPFAAAALGRDFHAQAQADAKRGAVPDFQENYTGPGKIETYTVFYGREGLPRFGTIIGLAPDGKRFLAKVPATDERGIEFLTGGKIEPVGVAGLVTAAEAGDMIWAFA